MILVDPRTVLQRPIANALADDVKKLDQEIESILREEQPLREKVRKYNEVLRDYLTRFDEYKTKQSPQLPPPHPHHSLIEEAEEEEEDVAEDVLISLPASRRAKAKRLLGYLKRAPDINWNQRGELIVRGQVQPRTHMVDLVKDVLLQRRTPVSAGWQTFAQALMDANVPQDLITNQYLRPHPPPPPPPQTTPSPKRKTKRKKTEWSPVP